jgi:hypothetical protein
MVKRTRLVSLADGRVIRLTLGEISAMKRYVAMNGEEGPQYNPGHVSYLTRRNLVTKGVLEMTGSGIPQFAKGVLSK